MQAPKGECRISRTAMHAAAGGWVLAAIPPARADAAEVAQLRQDAAMAATVTVAASYTTPRGTTWIGSVRVGGGKSGFSRDVGLGWPSDLAARVELRSSHP